MSALLDRSLKTEVTTTEQETSQARDLAAQLNSESLSGSQITLALKSAGGQLIEAPAELTAVLQTVIEAMGRGGTVTIGTVPKELTTTTAAKMLGISRPTLMQLIRRNELPSHLVGSHTRLFTKDVLKYKKSRTDVRRTALDELRALEDELGVED